MLPEIHSAFILGIGKRELSQDIGSAFTFY